MAHPVHEITVGGSIFRWQAEVLYLARGDSSGDSDRELGIRAAAEKCGFLNRCHFLGVSEPELFRRVIERDFDFFRTIRGGLVDWLEATRPEIICVDAYEGYNFTHDLCPLLLASALHQTAHEPKQVLEIPVGYLDPPIAPVEEEGAPLLWIDLNEEERAFKADLVSAWSDYGRDPERVIESLTGDIMHSDLFRRIEVPRDFLRPPVCGAKISYEEHGRRRVAEGKYEVALLHGEHYRPIAEALLEDTIVFAS